MLKTFLILGHPRCGTGFTHKLFNAMGFNVGHERVEDDGTSNWVYAVPDDTCFSWITHPRNYYQFKYVIHCVRDPLKAISSIAFTEIANEPIQYPIDLKIHLKQSTMFRRKHLNLMSDEYIKKPLIEQAIISFLGWNKLIESQNPDCVVRIEHAFHDLKECVFLSDKVNNITEIPSKEYNSRPHPIFNKEHWQKVDPELLKELDIFCEKYNYPSITSRIN